MNANEISNVDFMVEEFLLYRGFTQTFRCLENEKIHDKSRSFQENKIVEQIFQYLCNLEVDSFIALWDFLLKRFFLHLDQEHLEMVGLLKADLLKFYLVNAIKINSKQKVHEFFSNYSYEILAQSGDVIVQNLRPWYVLPFIEEPEKDREFAPYFSSKWSDALRVTLNNFLSVVLSNAPLPKLILLDRWFHSEEQQNLRAQLKQSLEEVSSCVKKMEQYEKRIQSLHAAIHDLSSHIVSICAAKENQRESSFIQPDEERESIGVKMPQGLDKAYLDGIAICQLSAECLKLDQECISVSSKARVKAFIGNLDRGPGSSPNTRPTKLKLWLSPPPDDNTVEYEATMIAKINAWLQMMGKDYQ